LRVRQTLPEEMGNKWHRSIKCDDISNELARLALALLDCLV
jgi:hypothetical protein